MTDVTSRYGRQLMAMVPKFYDQSDLYKSIAQTIGVEFDDVRVAMDDIIAQGFVQTATWSLPAWEVDYGLQVDESLGYDERRGKVLAKRRGVGPVNARLISSVVESYGWGSVHVEVDHHNYEVTVVFQNVKGVPPNDSIIKASVLEVLPAHIGLLWLYRFMTWDELGTNGLSWDQLDAQALTWDQFEAL